MRLNHLTIWVFFFFFLMALKKPCFSFSLTGSGGFMTMASAAVLRGKGVKLFTTICNHKVKIKLWLLFRHGWNARAQSENTGRKCGDQTHLQHEMTTAAQRKPEHYENTLRVLFFEQHNGRYVQKPMNFLFTLYYVHFQSFIFTINITFHGSTQSNII